MNKLRADIDSFFTDFNAKLTEDATKEIIIFPPACYLSYVKEKIDASPKVSMLKLGIQNISTKTSGAYTGQISAQQAVDCGCDYVLVGYSEVRQYLGVTADDCKEQINQALANNLKILYCVGETLEEMEAGETNSVLATQISTILFLSADQLANNVVLVYEPIWAIGTGKTCTAEQAEEAQAAIKNVIASKYGNEIAEDIFILYAGSINANSVAELFAKPDIKGCLAGGVSLKGTNFANMINVAVS